MFQITLSLTAAVLASSLISASYLDDQAWASTFKSKLGSLPQASGECYVCFYEQADYVGSKFCVGKQVESCTRVNPITAPGTIGSIKFGTGCNLVVNVRVMDVPFSEHIAVISKDATSTGYNVSADEHFVKEVYVEDAGCACFLGIPDLGDGYGVCYTNDVPAVDARYYNSITELMLFKSDAKNFDVVIYETQNYNRPAKPVIQQGVIAMSYRFTGSSKNLETNENLSLSGVKKSLQNKVRSIKFVLPDINATRNDSISAPASLSA